MFLLLRKGGCVALFFCVVCSAGPVGADSIPLVTGEWIPYTSETMENYGEFTQQVTMVFQEMGVEPGYRFYPWQRCFDAVVKGRVWAAFPYSHTATRAKQVWFSHPLSCSKTLFFYYETQDSAHAPYRVMTVKDLKKYRLGGVNGYYYQDFFKQAGLNVDYVNKEIHAIEKLKLGRIDLMPVNEQVGWHLINTRFTKERHRFKTLSVPLSVNTLCLIVSKEYPGAKQILEKFNQALASCLEKGRLEMSPCEPDVGLMK